MTDFDIGVFNSATGSRYGISLSSNLNAGWFQKVLAKNPSYRVWRIPVQALEKAGLRAVQRGANLDHFEVEAADGVQPSLGTYQAALSQVADESVMMPEAGEGIIEEVAGDLELAAQEAEVAVEDAEDSGAIPPP